MSSDEDDYMSDKFLSKNSSSDIRPGLIKNRSKQRDYEVQAKKAKIDEETRNKQKPSTVIQRKRLEEGLSSAISSDNKGFAMMAKMGYKKGEAIGKSQQGIVEPIGISIKSDRAGLGREAALQQLAERKAQIRKERLKAKMCQETITPEEYRKRMMQKAENKQNDADIEKCQRACEKLDLDEGITEPELEWFWPQRNIKEPTSGSENSDSETDDEIEYEPQEKLEMLTNYLRTMYLYCHWCGTKYDDLKDMEQNCPGTTKNDH